MASAKNTARFSQNQSLAILFLAILLTNCSQDYFNFFFKSLFPPKLCVWNRKITRENEILQHLPITLQTATAVSVHLPTLSKVTIFQNCEKSLLEQLVLKLTPQVRKQVAHLDRIKSNIRVSGTESRMLYLTSAIFFMFAVVIIGLYSLLVNLAVLYLNLFYPL